MILNLIAIAIWGFRFGYDLANSTLFSLAPALDAAMLIAFIFITIDEHRGLQK